MLCQSCLKNNANTHIKTIVNGETKELMLCSECAEKLGYVDLFTDFSFGFDDFFKSLWENESHCIEDTVRCSKCGSSFDDIIDVGKVGCPDCYSVFYDRMIPILERIHGNTTHKGKTAFFESETTRKINEVNSLKQELKLLIEKQEFERAAQVRDKIKELESQGDGNE